MKRSFTRILKEFIHLLILLLNIRGFRLRHRRTTIEYKREERMIKSKCSKRGGLHHDAKSDSISSKSGTGTK